MVEFHAKSGDAVRRSEKVQTQWECSRIFGTRLNGSFSNRMLRHVCRPTSLVLLLCLFSPSLRAQVAFDAATNAAQAAAGTTLTFAHTNTGTNLVLVVGVSLNIRAHAAATVSSVTYGASTLTRAVAQINGNNRSRTEIWYLNAAPAGTANVVVTVSNNGVPISAGAVSFTGADQTTPLRSSASNSDGGATGKYAYVNVNSSTNDYVFENLALVSGTTASSTSTAQVAQWGAASTVGTNDVYGFGSIRAGAASVPMSENLTATVNWADAAVSIQPAQADLSVSVAGSSAQYPANLTYTVTVTNNGPDTATTVSLTDTLPAGLTLVSALASGGTGGSCTGANCSWTSIAAGTSGTATIKAVPSAPGGYPLSASVSAASADLNTANNSATGVAYSEIDQCTNTTGIGNNAAITGTINEYFPGSATVSAGNNVIKLGTATGTAHTLIAGDLVLVIQMQDAAISTTNGSTYGDGISGSGSTNLNDAGVYEYASVVSYAAPNLTVKAAGPGGGLLYTYTSAAATNTAPAQGARTFQVVWVPNYNNGTLSGNLTAPAWNGSTGGIVALNIEGVLTLGGRTISVDGLGFRGGAGLWQSGAAGSLNTDYIWTAPTSYNTTTMTEVAGADGSKGEGIAGTPAWIENPTATADVVTSGAVACTTGAATACNEPGYPGGSMARGAPGNAGGGATDSDPTANDQNAGGGGGANGGAGGQGGDSWNTNLSVGGLGGTAFPAGVSRVVMGGGGGAGSSNNNNDCETPLTGGGPFTVCPFVSSSGAAGGGIVMINAAQITGNVTITANGYSAFNSTPQDGGGGGGAGGSIIFLWGSVSAGTSTITLTADGGRGGDAWDSDEGGTNCQGPCAGGGGGLTTDRHGPGGGGGGGVILYSTTANATATPTVTGGAAAVTLDTANLFYGSTAGGNGVSTPGITPASSAGPHNSSACTDLAITKSAVPNPVIVNNTLTYTLTVTNTTTAAAPVFVTDNIPSDVTFNFSNTAPLNPTITGGTSGSCGYSSPVLTCSWSSLGAGATGTITITATASTPYTLATNTAIVNSPGLADSNPANNTATLNVPIEGPTAVRLNSFSAIRSGNGALLSWASGGEVRNLGFNVYREVGGQKVLLNPSLIAGSALLMREALPQHGARSYGWTDPSPTAGAMYWLEDVDLNGTRTMHGPVPLQNSPPIQPPSVQAQSLSQARSLPQLKPPSRALTMAEMSTVAPNLSATHFRETVARPAMSANTINVGFQLAADPAIKILVDHEGWYQVTQPQLVAAGLPANIRASSLQLFAEGVEQPIRVLGEDIDFGPQSAIEFYGTPIDTPYSGQRVYWLSWKSASGLRVADARSGTAGPSEPSFVQAVELKPRFTYFAALLRDDTDNFFGPLVSPTPATLPLSLQNVAAGQGSMEVSLQGVTTNQQHTVSVDLNGAVLGEMTFDGQALAKADFQIPNGILTDGANTISLTSQMGTADISVVNYVDVKFPHTYTAESDFLKFTAQSGQNISVGGFIAPPARLVDITDPVRPLMLNFQSFVEQGIYTLNATVPWTTSGQHTLLALSDQALGVAAGLSPHAPSTLRATQPGANVVMLTAPQFHAEMQPLADLHRSQGYSVALLDVNQIYDEFNFGEPSPYAIKSFLRNSEIAWHNKPRYLLLGGDASIDPRDYLGFGFFDFVPTKAIVTSELKTASDDWFSDFDNSGFATIATGRMPGRTTTDMQTMVSKTLEYASAPNGSWTNNTMMVADVGDPSVSFSQESLVVQKMLPPSMNVSDYFVDALGVGTVRQDILSGIQSGQTLVDYNGHGSVEVWAGGHLFDDTVATALTNGNQLPVFVMMNCLNGYFHDVFTESLASALLLAPNGGAVAAWASSGLSAPAPQFQMNQVFVKDLFSAQPLALGDAALDAKQGITDPDARRTFILFGDPLLHIKQPVEATAVH